MSTGGNSRDGRVSLSDAVGSFKSRKRKSIVVTASLLIVSLLVLTIGVAATTRTHNVTVGGYYPGAILGFGSFLGIIGAHLIENKRQMLVASIVFISFGVVAALCCAIVDGVFAARHIVNRVFWTNPKITVLLVIVGLILTCMKHSVCNILQDLGPLYAGRCEYYSSVTSYDRDVHCQTASRVSCNLRVKSNTCYCCELYTCGSRVELTGGYHEYTEVRSCQDVVQLYHLLWFATVLNIVALLLGIVTAAVLGGFKDMTPTGTPDSCEPGPIAAPASAPALAPAAAPSAPLSEVPHLPPAPHSSYYNNAPCLPPYTAYDVQGSTMFPDSSGLSDDSQSGASYLWPTQIPPRYSPPYYPPDEKPPPYSP